MGDPELEAIKAKRLAQLKSHYGVSLNVNFIHVWKKS